MTHAWTCSEGIETCSVCTFFCTVSQECTEALGTKYGMADTLMWLQFRVQKVNKLRSL